MAESNRLVWLTMVFFVESIFAYLGPKMGLLNTCDDGKTNLQMDWSPSDFRQFTCMEPSLWKAQDGIEPEEYSIPNFDPRKDVVYHKCMDEAINYDEKIPLRGDHRPNWAVFGEYLYLPPQRWLHNLEKLAQDFIHIWSLSAHTLSALPLQHGSVVFLYHPCADQTEVDRLRKIVTSCLYRYIITPSDRLSIDRPLGLITWGSKLLMNRVDKPTVVKFIKAHARKAPEDLYRQGLYNFMLLKASEVVPGSEISDSNVCPNM